VVVVFGIYAGTNFTSAGLILVSYRASNNLIKGSELTKFHKTLKGEPLQSTEQATGSYLHSILHYTKVQHQEGDNMFCYCSSMHNWTPH
jgi:hypothetical protein